MKIYLGADHNGFYFKQKIEDFLSKNNYLIDDLGDKKLDPQDDYPIFARKVVNNVLSSPDLDPRGILLCGSGQGMMIAANRVKGIRACLGWSEQAAKDSRNDEDSNILCLPASVLNTKQSLDIIKQWLDTPFSNAPRHIRRMRELDEMDS
ncbi:MAG TPA: RpiB/LacA/LacB family sugar-phosphate isomerase [Candidatus Saccharimonadales bacterium]|jgi:ribose 5-phosphate isomerase B|nr:RpiB/LacA/LacB family sugar-phosphate isomerase [Candidatus Saccharimonadales bacterium]